MSSKSSQASRLSKNQRLAGVENATEWESSVIERTKLKDGQERVRLFRRGKCVYDSHDKSKDDIPAWELIKNPADYRDQVINKNNFNTKI